ncbi:MAG: hypothetical protein ABFD18_16365 [Syntrophomonas sp.]
MDIVEDLYKEKIGSKTVRISIEFFKEKEVCLLNMGGGRHECNESIKMRTHETVFILV